MSIYQRLVTFFAPVEKYFVNRITLDSFSAVTAVTGRSGRLLIGQ